MAINFPNSPVNGETFSAGSSTYIYDSAKSVWNLVTTTIVGPTGPLGPTGPSGGGSVFSSTGTVNSFSDTGFDASVYSSAEYTVYVKNASGKYTSKVMLICDGTSTATITEYAILTAGTAPSVTLTAANTSGTVTLTVASASATQIRLSRSLVEI